MSSKFQCGALIQNRGNEPKIQGRKKRVQRARFGRTVPDGKLYLEGIFDTIPIGSRKNCFDEEKT